MIRHAGPATPHCNAARPAFDRRQYVAARTTVRRTTPGWPSRRRLEACWDPSRSKTPRRLRTIGGAWACERAPELEDELHSEPRQDWRLEVAVQEEPGVL